MVMVMTVVPSQNSIQFKKKKGAKEHTMYV